MIAAANMYAVTSVAWIPRGMSKSRPTKAEINEEELKKFAQECNGMPIVFVFKWQVCFQLLLLQTSFHK